MYGITCVFLYLFIYVMITNVELCFDKIERGCLQSSTRVSYEKFQICEVRIKCIRPMLVFFWYGSVRA